MLKFGAMSSAPKQLLVALRKSALSLCHAQYIRDRLLAHYPECEITLRGITTQGDRILEKPLADIGGKGLFIEEIETAMREGRADVAVHSLKDMPMEMAPGFIIAAVPVREDPRDALVCNKYRVDRGAARRRGRRHVEPAARSAAAREESDAERASPARQREHARAQARRRASTTR